MKTEVHPTRETRTKKGSHSCPSLSPARRRATHSCPSPVLIAASQGAVGARSAAARRVRGLSWGAVGAANRPFLGAEPGARADDVGLSVSFGTRRSCPPGCTCLVSITKPGLALAPRAAAGVHAAHTGRGVNECVLDAVVHIRAVAITHADYKGSNPL